MQRIQRDGYFFTEGSMSSYAIQALKALGIQGDLIHGLTSQLKFSSSEAGEVVLRRGEMVDSWRLIVTGLVAECVPMQEGVNTPLNIYSEGLWFGENSIINSRSADYNYVCVCATEFLVFPHTVLLSLLETELEFACHMAKMMAWRTHTQSEMLCLTKVGNACVRVIVGLALLAEALLIPPNQASVVLHVKQGMLAQLCGVSRTVFSAYVQHLKTGGWLNIKYGNLELISIDTWKCVLARMRQAPFWDVNPSIVQLLAEFSSAERCLSIQAQCEWQASPTLPQESSEKPDCENSLPKELSA